MADNVPITAGSGTSVATDDVSAVHYQRVKLTDGTADSSTAIVAGGGVEANALCVTIANDSTGLVSVDDNGASLTVDGSVTANAGSNLNTSALALEGGGNLAAAAASLSVVDDWDNGASDGASVSGDVAHDGTDAGEPVKIGGYAKAAAPTDVSADADRVNAWFLRNGALATVVTAAGALVAGDATNGLDVDVTRLPALVAGTANIGDVDVLTVPADPFGANADAASASGSISAKLRFIAATGIPVTGSVAVTNAALNVGANSGAKVEGDVAHDGVDAGNPQKLGMRALAHGTNPTAVAAADRTDWLANRAGVPWVMGGHPNIVTIKHTTITTAVTDVAIVTVAGGLKIVVTSFIMTLDNASTVFPTVLMGFAAVNTPTTTGVIAAHGGVPAGGGFSRGDGSGIIGIGADGEDLRITTTGNATGNGLQVVVSYYTIES